MSEEQTGLVAADTTQQAVLDPTKADSPELQAALTTLLATGDLAALTDAQKTSYYLHVARSLGLNPYTRPFDFIDMDGTLVLYVKKDATEQLRKIHGVSIRIINRQLLVGGVYSVTARAVMPNGRTDESTGVVAIGDAKGQRYANKLMAAETKAKRRATLSIVGLGWLDESEVADVPSARDLKFDYSNLRGLQDDSDDTTHWTLDAASLDRFRSAAGDLRLSGSQVIQALSQDRGIIIRRVGEYGGTLDEAIAAMQEFAAVGITTVVRNDAVAAREGKATQEDVVDGEIVDVDDDEEEEESNTTEVKGVGTVDMGTGEVVGDETEEQDANGQEEE